MTCFSIPLSLQLAVYPYVDYINTLLTLVVEMVQKCNHHI